jgi:hypothetical protein
MIPLGATPAEVIRAAFLLRHVCGSLEDLPGEMADSFAYQCLRTIMLRAALTRGRHLRLCVSTDPREQQAVEELAHLETRLDEAPRLLHLWREARRAGRIEAELGSSAAASGMGYGAASADGALYDMVSGDMRSLAGGSAEVRRSVRAVRQAEEMRGLYRELKAVLGGRAVIPLPD